METIIKNEKNFTSLTTMSKIIKKLQYELSLRELVNYKNNVKRDNDFLKKCSRKNINDENKEKINIIKMDEIFDIIYKKENDIIRSNYLRKLNIFNENNHDRFIQNCIILDWDDTLLCTTFLIAKNILDIKQLEKDEREQLIELDNVILNLLNKFYKKANIYIITNSKEGWVEYSSQIFLPKTHNYLKKNYIKIISARNIYEEYFPNEDFKWKQEAFLDLSKFYKTEKLTNIICIGDNKLEMEASSNLANCFDSVFLKKIKFCKYPSINE